MSINEIDKEDEIDLLALVGLIYKNLIIIISITFVFIIGVLVYCIVSIKLPPEESYLPNTFSPKSTVILNNSYGGNPIDSMLNSTGMSNLAGLAGISSGGKNLSDSNLAMKLVTTYSFIERINKEFNLDQVYETSNTEFPETNLKNAILARLRISEDDVTGLIYIMYTDIDKYLATEIVNRVTDLLEEEFSKIDIIRNKSQRTVLENKKEMVEIELDRLQNKIRIFQNKHNLIDVNVVFSELMKQLTELQSQLLMKNVSIDSYSQISSVKDPGYLKLISERDALERAIDLVKDGKTGNYPPLDTLPELSMELEYLKRELGVQTNVYNSIITQLESLKLTSDGTGPTFQILELARVPEKKSGPNRTKLCIQITIIGFIISLFVVFLKEVFLYFKNAPEKIKKLKGIK